MENFDWGEIGNNKWFLDTLNKELFVDDVYRKYFTVDDGDVVLDIGASVGPFARLIEDSNPKEIYCFEPAAELYPTLIKNAENSKIHTYCLNLGISDKDGTSMLPGLYNGETMEICDPSNAKIANTIKFKTFIEKYQISVVDFLKTDCEGSEYDIFNDENYDWIKNNVRKIVGEFHLHNEEQKIKFKKFRDTYLKNYANIHIESMDGIDIKESVWSDWFIEHYSAITIYIDNRSPKINISSINLLSALEKYIENPNDPQCNFNLGWAYESLKQTGSAISFYLRTAERAEDQHLQYESLIRCGLCFERQGTRDDTVKVLYQKSISLLPQRPEAYFLLSRLYEVNKMWQDSYMMACLGIYLKEDCPDLHTDVEYPGHYALIFQKAVASWWVGLCEEARELMAELKINYKMNELFGSAVDRNLNSIGYPSTTSPYIRGMMDKIRFKFDNITLIDRNNSQSYQDMFVLAATNGKMGGKYLEIGSAEPFMNNNTALLETKFGWKGVSIDINRTVVEQFMSERNNMVFCLDATKVNYEKFLGSLGFEDDFDYLQVDCDPPQQSFNILKSIPFDRYRFATITFEHDYYADQSVRDESRKYLESKGYILVASDIAYNKTNSYEDWWVHPEMVPEEIVGKLKDISVGTKYAKDYMFPL